MSNSSEISDLEVSETTSDESSKEENRFSCNVPGCPKKFRKNRNLQNHLRLHKGERPYICNEENCSKAYTNSSHLRRHKKMKHTDYNERIMCTIPGCNKELANKTCLKKHIYRLHCPDRVYPFKCSECSQGFERKRQLQQHSFLHTGHLPFKCEKCEAKFLTTLERRRHERRHRNYVCECKETFQLWSALLAHKKTCKNRKIQCHVCDKHFSNKRNLRLHIDTHLGKEDRTVFICPYEECDRYYMYKANLTFHINSLHKKVAKPKIPCTFEGCSKLLSRMRSYEEHLKTHLATNKTKFPRKPRKDKGQRKKKIIDTLARNLSSENNEGENIETKDST